MPKYLYNKKDINLNEIDVDFNEEDLYFVGGNIYREDDIITIKFK